MIVLPLGVELGFDHSRQNGAVESEHVTQQLPRDQYFVYLMLRMGGVDRNVLASRVGHSVSPDQLDALLLTLSERRLAVAVSEDLWANLVAIPVGEFVGHRPDGYALAQILSEDVALPIGPRSYILWSVLSPQQSLATIFSRLEQELPQVPTTDWRNALIALAKLRLITFHFLAAVDKHVE